MKLKTIVVATDFSESAARAVARAARVAAHFQARLHLVHAVNLAPLSRFFAYVDNAEGEIEHYFAEARSKADAIVGEMAERTGVRPEVHIAEGKAASVISEAVRSIGADLLVVGEHGENLLADMFVGGTALKCLNATAVPVLMVRNASDGDYRCLLTAIDFSPAAAAACRLGQTLFPEASHHWLHVFQLPLEGRMRLAGASEDDLERFRSAEETGAREKLAHFLEEFPDVRRVAQAGTPAAGIITHAAASGCDLILIGRHGNGALDERLLGSVAQNVLYHSRCDVMVVPD